MPSFPSNSQTQPSYSRTLPIASNFLISFAAVPLVAGLLVTRAVTDFLMHVGSESEEVFRGDRLPVLNFPHSDND